MTRVFLSALVVIAVAIVPSAAAHHNPNHTKGPNENSTKKCTVKKGFVVKGVLTEGSTVTDNSVDNFDVTRANRNARRAGHGPDSANDPGSYEGSVKRSGYEEGESPGAGDKVRVLGKIEYDRCDGSDGDGTGFAAEPTVRKIRVIDGDDEA